MSYYSKDVIAVGCTRVINEEKWEMKYLKYKMFALAVLSKFHWIDLSWVWFVNLLNQNHVNLCYFYVKRVSVQDTGDRIDKYMIWNLWSLIEEHDSQCLRNQSGRFLILYNHKSQNILENNKKIMILCINSLNSLYGFICLKKGWI